MREERSSKLTNLLEVLTVGLPFCGFKILTGLRLADSALLPLRLLGAFLLGLGVLDGVINGANLVGLLVKGRRPMAACAFAFAMRASRKLSSPPEKWHELGSSFDVLLSFALVALVIGSGWLRAMPPDQLAAWNVCVILNVLGAGLGRFGDSLRGLAQDA